MATPLSKITGQRGISLAEAARRVADAPPPGRPWGILKDGDLREILWRVACLKTPSSLSFSAPLLLSPPVKIPLQNEAPLAFLTFSSNRHQRLGLSLH